MSKRGIKKNWRLVITPSDNGKPFTVVKSVAPSRDEMLAIHNRGDAVTLVYVHPDTGHRRIELELPGLGSAPEGMKRCAVCGTAAKVDEFNRFTSHDVGSHDVPCEHPESPDEHGPFVIALPDLRPGDKVRREGDGPATSDFGDRLIGTVIEVAPTRVRVSWPLDGYLLEFPHELRAVPAAPDTLSALALHRPAGVPDAPADYNGPTALFVFPTTGDNRMSLYGPGEKALGIISHDAVPNRLGSTVAEVLRGRGWEIVGLIVEHSRPGAPVYAIRSTHLPKRGALADILVGPHHAPGDAGISGRSRYVVILDDRIPEKYRRHEPNDGAPAVKVEPRGNFPTVLTPVAEVPRGRTGYMASGAYVSPGIGEGSWWRLLFGHDQPVRLHDRTDTWSDYAALTS